MSIIFCSGISLMLFSGPLLAHFKGALPEAVIQDGGSM